MSLKVIFSTEHLFLWFKTAQPETLELSKIPSSFFLSSSKQMKRAKNYEGYMESSKKVVNGGVFQLQIFQAFFH